MSKKRASLARNLFVVTALLITVAMLTVGAISLIWYRGSAIEENGRRARAIAVSVASLIDGDEFEATILAGVETDYVTTVTDLVNKVHLEAGTQYLYVLYDINSADVTYFVDAHNDDYPDYLLFGDKEDISEHDPMLMNTYLTGEKTTTGVYYTPEYGSSLSAYSVIRNSNDTIIGVVGADIDAEHINSSILGFGVLILITTIVLSFFFGLIAYVIIRRTIGKPVSELTVAANRLAVGETEIDIEVKSNDEIGQLMQSFISLEGRTKTQVAAIQEIADGNYSIDVEPTSNSDALNVALKEMLSESNRVISMVQNVASQVAAASNELASGAQDLAERSTEQAISTNELSQAIGTVFEQTRKNARSAEETLDVVINVSKLMQESTNSMGDMREAMSNISASSEDIGKIIKTIDDIAFQTNILALNASVEAARAGVHGKGFAVVADEVRNLAKKSAEAAKETAVLIQRSFDQVSLGDRIVRETSISIQKVAENAEVMYTKIRQINDSSKEQELAVEKINSGVEQIAYVVQMNSATSEESVAMSHEMSDQAKTLSEITGRFKLRDDVPGLPGRDRRY
jgi:Methyl-accepting chemotaxis protein